jgi:hypothetical protein
MCADTVVGERLVEVLDIICNRLNRSNGLLYSTYLPAPKNGTWQGAPESDINYGEEMQGFEALWGAVKVTLEGIAAAVTSTTSTTFHCQANKTAAQNVIEYCHGSNSVPGCLDDISRLSVCHTVQSSWHPHGLWGFNLWVTPGSQLRHTCLLFPYAGTNLEIGWLVPDTLDYLLSINAEKLFVLHLLHT